jgi:putative cell wall-binding protein
LLSKKNAYERGELANIINERIEKIESMTKSNLSEVNTFLHTVHADFENFLHKHKKEHTGVNMKLLKFTEDLSTAL